MKNDWLEDEEDAADFPLVAERKVIFEEGCRVDDSVGSAVGL